MTRIMFLVEMILRNEEIMYRQNIQMKITRTKKPTANLNLSLKMLHYKSDWLRLGKIEGLVDQLANSGELTNPNRLTCRSGSTKKKIDVLSANATRFAKVGKHVHRACDRSIWHIALRYAESVRVPSKYTLFSKYFCPVFCIFIQYKK